MMNGNWLGLDGQVVIVTGGASGIGKNPNWQEIFYISHYST